MSIFFTPKDQIRTKSLSPGESQHCTQVLRHQVGDLVHLIDGEGGKYDAKLTAVHKKKCSYEILEKITFPKKSFTIHLAIAPTKNMDRMEWMVEKLTEIGVDQISLIVTDHSERRKIRLDRLEKKIISALKQSGNPFKPVLSQMESLQTFVKDSKEVLKVIAHVAEGYKYLGELLEKETDTCILIGPEGDFTAEELQFALLHDFKPISLGGNTLRTETAGLIASCHVNFINNF